MGQNQLPYVEGIQDGAREIVKLIGQLPTRSISHCIYCTKIGTFFLLIIAYTSYMIFRRSSERQIVKLATTPRNVFDKIGLLVSNVFVFGVLPAFVIFNVVIYQWIIWGGKLYEGKMLTIGYFLHTSTGSLYFIAGGLQFYSPLRQFYPRIHRLIGYVYYIMAFITSFGILILAVKPHSGFATQIAVATFLPPWISCNYLALRSILVFKDVELHRCMILICYVNVPIFSDLYFSFTTDYSAYLSYLFISQLISRRLENLYFFPTHLAVLLISDN